MPVSATEATTDNSRMQSIQFHGVAREYFGIWLSNTVLTILTFGIYSAWAKVRRKRYFLNCTRIANDSFAYHATGGQLLLGRILSVALLAAYTFVTTIYPFLVFVLLPVFFLALAWVFNRSLKFNARMTSWRNVRFNWHGTYGKTFLFLILMPLIGVASAGLLLPLCSRLYYQYYAKSYSFGAMRFDAMSKVGSYYVALLIAGVTALIPAVLLAVIILSVMWDSSSPYTLWNHILLAVLLATAVFIVVTSFLFRALCRNILVRTLTLGDAVKFNSSISPLLLAWIVTSNFFAIILSLGMLIPWAAVRQYRYLAQKTEYEFLVEDQGFVDDQREKMSAFGEEFVTLEGYDVGF